MTLYFGKEKDLATIMHSNLHDTDNVDGPKSHATFYLNKDELVSWFKFLDENGFIDKAPAVQHYIDDSIAFDSEPSMRTDDVIGTFSNGEVSRRVNDGNH